MIQRYKVLAAAPDMLEALKLCQRALMIAARGDCCCAEPFPTCRCVASGHPCPSCVALAACDEALEKAKIRP